MALDAKQIAELLKLRALGFNQEEIAQALETSQQVIAYQLKKLKEQAKTNGIDEVFNSALMGGLAGAVAGCLLYTSPSPRDKRQSRMPSSA